MARLPNPGGDEEVWGDVLNEYLRIEHNEDGTLKRGPEITTAASEAQTAKNTATTVQNTLSSHLQATQGVHGITDTSALETVTGAQTKITTAINGVNDSIAEVRSIARSSLVTSLGVDANNLPLLTKYEDNPILTVQQTTLSNMMWASMLRVADYLPAGQRLGDYYMWYSSDHAQSGEGICMAYADSPYGPWTERAGGRIITSATPGSANQPESPHVVWNPETSRFHIYFSVGVASGGSSQHTRCLLTPNGYDTFTDPGVRIAVPENQFPDNVHTGYFRPFRVAGQWWAYSYLGGQSGGSKPIVSHAGFWSSRDGLTWQVDPRPLGPGRNWLTDTDFEDWQHSWFHSHVILWRGSPWIIASVVPVGSGGGAETGVQWIAAPLAPSLRQLAGRPRFITAQNQAWEGGAVSRIYSVLVDGDNIICIYQGLANDSGFGIATLNLENL